MSANVGRIFYNLRLHCWSVQRRVRRSYGLRWVTVGHPSTVMLRDVHLVVSQKVREKVLRTRRKDVHAWAYGIIVRTGSRRPGRCTVPVTYNPYRAGHFTVRGNTRPVWGPFPTAFAGTDRTLWCALNER